MHKFGAVLSDPAKPRVKFGDHVYGVAIPPTAAHWGHDPVIGMHLNDRWGDCVWGALANRLEIQSYYGTGREAVIPDSAVLTGYESTGFNPAAGPPGDNPTDNGTQLIDGLKYTATTGLNGQHIGAYSNLDVPHDLTFLKLAIAELGPALLALQLPDYAENQFANQQPWEPEGGGSIVGGHAVLGTGYDATYLYVQTWNAIQAVTWNFVSEYFMEGWAIMSPVWANAAHVNLVTLQQEFNALHRPKGWLDRLLDRFGQAL